MVTCGIAGDTGILYRSENNEALNTCGKKVIKIIYMIPPHKTQK